MKLWIGPIGFALLILAGWIIDTTPTGLIALGAAYLGMVGGGMMVFGAAGLGDWVGGRK